MAGTEADQGSKRDQPPRKVRRPNLVALLSFLGAFVLLIIVFRTVLFPFLMAIFIAYLVEPLVAYITRSKIFGMKWTRGPAIVAVYVVVLGGVLLLAWRGVTKAATMIKETSGNIAAAAKEEAPRVEFRLVTPPGETGEDGAPKEAHDQPIVIPKGTEIARLRGAHVVPRAWRYRTLYEVKIEPGQDDANSIVERVDTPDDYFADYEFTTDSLDEKPPNVVLAPAGLAAITMADGKTKPPHPIEVKLGEPAKGLELFLERRLISPIVGNLKNADFDVEPRVVRQFVSLKAEALSEDLPAQLTKGAVNFAGQVALSIYEFFLILMLTAFIVTDRRGIARFFSSLPPDTYKPAYNKLMTYIDDGLAGVIRGQLVICGVNGVLTYIGLLLLSIPGAWLLALVAAVLSLIPIFGTIVSSIPIVLIGLTKGIDIAILALVWIVFIHMLEANLLNPLIMGSHAQMHPVIIVFALLAGEHAFGVWGALLAVPTMSIIQSCFRFYLHEIEGLPREEHAPHGEWFRQKIKAFVGLFKKEKAEA